MKMEFAMPRITTEERRAAETLKTAVFDIEQQLVSPSSIDDLKLYAEAAILATLPARAESFWADIVSASNAIRKAGADAAPIIQRTRNRLDDRTRSGGWQQPDALQEQQQKRTVFPPDVFPQYIENFVNNMCKAQQLDRAAVACGVLGAAAGACQGRFWVKHPDGSGHHEHLPLYVVVVQSPSQRKSAALSAVLRPIYAAISEQSDDYKRKCAETKGRKKAAAAELRALEKEMTKATDDEEKARISEKIALIECKSALIEAPSSPHCVFQDVTPEALGQQMTKTAETAIVASAEAQTLLILSGMYTAGGSVNIGLMNASSSGEPCKIVRAKDGGTVCLLECPLQTQLLYIQPTIWEEVEKNRQLEGSGYLARFLRCIIPDRPEAIRYRISETADAKAAAEYDATIADFISIPRNLHADPVEVVFSEEAAEVMERHLQPILDERQPGGLYADNPLSELTGKLPGYITRIAALLHLLQYPCTPKQYETSQTITAHNTPISRETAENACKIGEFFLENAVSETQTAAASLDKLQTRVLHAILKQTVFKGRASCTIRDFKRTIAGSSAILAQADTILQDLASGSLIEIQTACTGGKKSRTEIFVNPFVAKAVFRQL